jgi:type II secretory pathway component PulJ
MAGRRRRGARCGRGFTLIEVVLAIALTMVIAGAAIGLATTLLTRRAQIDEEAARDRGVAILMDQVEQDLLGVVAGTGRESGFVGSAREMTLRVRGVTLRREDLIEARYRFVASGEGTLKPGRVIARRGVSGVEETLADGVALVRLRYHDGVAWVEAFDSASKGELPWAVEVAVWLGDPAEFAAEFGGEAAMPEPTSDRDEMRGDADAASDLGLSGAGLDGGFGSEVIGRPPDRVRVIVVPDGVGPTGTGEAIGGDA